MSTQTQCPSCDSRLKVPDECIGQKVRCPRCQEVFTANAPDLDEDEAPRRSRRQEEEYSDAPARSRRPAADEEEHERPARSRRDEKKEPALRRLRKRHDPEAAARRIAEAEARAGVPNPFALTALMLGIASLPLAFCCGWFGIPVAVVAIAFGIFALQKPYGQGFAWAGVACGGLAIVLFVAMLLVSLALETAQ